MDIRSLFFTQPYQNQPSTDYWGGKLADLFLASVVKPATKKIMSNPASFSHYLDPIDYTEGRLAGYSRNYGDASSSVQMQVMKKILDYSSDFSKEDQGLLLAIARLESGFNPDAAATSTSASGVFQFIKSTGKAYGLTDEDRFDADANIKAGVRFFADNVKLFDRKFPGLEGSERAVMLYALHHDGPSLKYGGEAIARREILPYLERFQFTAEGYAASNDSTTAST